jgi:hypothetical protein
MTDAEAADTTDDIDPLTRIAIKHGTDKWGAHFYTPIYHELFMNLRGSAVRLLEIGIGGYNFHTIGGASLAMWAEYFPRGRIVGIDIVPKKLSLDPRVVTLVGSQSDPAFLKRVCDEHGPFDIVIDDGSHVPQHVVTSFYTLFPLLADGGLYVIEDVQTTFWPRFGGSVIDGGPTSKLALAMLAYLNHAEIKVQDPKVPLAPFAHQVRSMRAFHNLIVIEKGDNSEPSNGNYDPTNVHAVRALRLITRELERSPTPEGFANLLDIYIMTNNLKRAAIVLEESLARWPDHSVLLSRAAMISGACGDERGRLAFIQRLVEKEPDNQPLRQELQSAREKLSSATRTP